MLKFSLVSLSALAAASAAHAQAGPTTTTNDADENEIVVTASRVPLTAREVGSAVTVITQEDLQAQQITFAKDILQDLAGIQISSDRPGDTTSVSIRGSDNDQVLYLIDGIELGDPSSTSTEYNSQHLVTRDIARIEVLRGNQSSLYGSDAIGGVVNILTKRAAGEGLEVNAEGEFGSYDTLNGGLSVLGKRGPVDFRVTATGYKHDGPSLADNGTEDDEYWRYGLSGRIGLAASDNVDLQLIGFWQDSDTSLDNTTSDNSDTVRKEEWAYAARGTFTSDDGRLKADAVASRYVAQRLYFGEFYPAEGDLYEGIKEAASLNASYDSQGLFSIAAGANYEKESTEQVTSFSGVFDEKVTTKAGYAEVALRPAEGFILTGAARIDDNSRFGSFDTYRATAAYVIGNAIAGGDVKLRASYGTGAKAPGLYQLFDPTYGNPDLEVETSKGGDIGIDLNFGNRFTAELSYFYARMRNEIVFDGSLGDFGGYAQFGRTRKAGIEAAFTLKPATWLELRQSYTYIEADEFVPGTGTWEDLGRAKHSGSTSLTISPVERLSLTARARYRADNELNFSRRRVEGYEVVDLLGAFAITDNVELFGRVVNLFDKDYQMSYGKNALGQSFYGGVRVGF